MKWKKAIDTRNLSELTAEEKGTQKVINGVINAEDLDDPKVFELAKAARARDMLEHETGILLAPVKKGTDGTRSHFQEYGSTIRMLGDKEEDDGRHDARVSTILRRLPKEELLILKVGDRELLKVQLAEYSWDAEVHRIVTYEKFIRHDVFGMVHKSNMSIRRPNVAIEVINTHYPDEETLDAMLCVSKNVPLVVIFDLVQYDGLQRYFFNLAENKKLGDVISPKFYIYRGEMFDNFFGVINPKNGETKANCLKRRIIAYGEVSAKNHQNWLKKK